jgi:hypothetical protein
MLVHFIYLLQVSEPVEIWSMPGGHYAGVLSL